MASSALSLGRLPGWIVAGVVLAMPSAALIAVGVRAESGRGLGSADWAAVQFTLTQAAASAVISGLLAVPLARALARQSFQGRGILITLLGAPFLLPVIVAVMGLLSLFGRNGIVTQTLEALGLPQLSIYGFWGVVLAHVFFNLPLVTRLLLQGWAAIPAEQFRLLAQLRVGSATAFRMIEIPLYARILPGALGLVFVLCLSSFAVALLLGGGPRATTIELAIYQAFRFDFDLARAAFLSVIQLILALSVCLALWRVLPMAAVQGGLDRPVEHYGASRADIAVILFAALCLLAPMISVILRGVPYITELPPLVWEAAGRSLVLGLVSAALTLLMALPLCVLGVRQGAWEGIGIIGLAISPLILGTGWFLVLRAFANPTDFALWVTAAVNALMALPFALRALLPAMQDVVAQYTRLSLSLGLTGWRFWRVVLLARMRRPLGFTAGLAGALSVGDLGVIALFADPERATLPLVIEQLRGAYRVDAAAGASVLLAGLSLSMFAAFDLWGRRHA